MDPDTSVHQDINEFLHAYYGSVADRIHGYLELLHRSVHDKGHHAHIYDPPTAFYLSSDVMDAAEKLFDQAEQAAENDEVRFRVQVARLPIWFVKRATSRVTGDARTELLHQFLAIARRASRTSVKARRSTTGPRKWARTDALESEAGPR